MMPDEELTQKISQRQEEVSRLCQKWQQLISQSQQRSAYLAGQQSRMAGTEARNLARPIERQAGIEARNLAGHMASREAKAARTTVEAIARQERTKAQRTIKAIELKARQESKAQAKILERQLKAKEAEDRKRQKAEERQAWLWSTPAERQYYENLAISLSRLTLEHEEHLARHRAMNP